MASDPKTEVVVTPFQYRSGRTYVFNSMNWVFAIIFLYRVEINAFFFKIKLHDCISIF